jgi:pimeloyl-ACP methyl ester carboxylesterase
MASSIANVPCAAGLAFLIGCTTLRPVQSVADFADPLIDGGPAARAPPPLPPQVFLLRGLWDIFSLGLDDLADKLNASGFAATALSGGPGWLNLAQQLRAEYADGETRPLVLVGHSYGADEAVGVARYLGEHGIGVDLLALVDATNPPAIPANVNRCVQWYIPSELGDWAPRDFAGNPVIAAPDNDHTLIENRIFTTHELGPQAHGANHFNIDEHPYLHELIILEIQNLEAEHEAAIQTVQK